MELVQLPISEEASISKSLRTLANDIEEGKHGDAVKLAWILDEGDGQVSLGMMGNSLSSEAEAHLLFSIAQRHIEGM